MCPQAGDETSLPQPDQEVVTVPDLGSLSSPLIDTERNLGLLLGLHASSLAVSTPLSPVEVECASKKSFVFRGQMSRLFQLRLVGRWSRTGGTGQDAEEGGREG